MKLFLNGTIQSIRLYSRVNIYPIFTPPPPRQKRNVVFGSCSVNNTIFSPLCCDLVNPLPRHHKHDKLHVISIDNSENIRMLNQPSNHVYTQHAVALSQIRMIHRRPLTRRLNDRNRDHAPLMPSHSRPVYIPR